MTCLLVLLSQFVYKWLLILEPLNFLIKRRVLFIFDQNSGYRKLNQKTLKSSSFSGFFFPGDQIDKINWLINVLDLINANKFESSDFRKRIDRLRSKPKNGSSSVPVMNLQTVPSVMFSLLQPEMQMSKWHILIPQKIYWKTFC